MKSFNDYRSAVKREYLKIRNPKSFNLVSLLQQTPPLDPWDLSQLQWWPSMIFVWPILFYSSGKSYSPRLSSTFPKRCRAKCLHSGTSCPPWASHRLLSQVHTSLDVSGSDLLQWPSSREQPTQREGGTWSLLSVFHTSLLRNPIDGFLYSNDLFLYHHDTWQTSQPSTSPVCNLAPWGLVWCSYYVVDSKVRCGCSNDRLPHHFFIGGIGTFLIVKIYQSMPVRKIGKIDDV